MQTSLESSLVRLHHLTSLHLLSPLYSVMSLNDEDLHRIARQCSTTLRQIGFRNRVWLIDRQSLLPTTPSKVSQEEVLKDGRKVVLKRWDMSAGTFPEVLLVVRL
jgi:hypothetical protein